MLLSGGKGFPQECVEIAHDLFGDLVGDGRGELRDRSALDPVCRRSPDELADRDAVGERGAVETLVQLVRDPDLEPELGHPW